LLKVLILDDIYSSNEPYPPDEFLDSPDVQNFIKVNEHLAVRYFNKERFEKLMEWLFTISVIKQGKITLSELKSRYNIFQKVLKASEESEYKFEEFRQAIKRESKDIF
jgi:hypothetical protein